MNLRTRNLGKQYGQSAWGIRKISLECGAGVHGLLGPNGAGKSTLMQILTTVMKPTTGTVYWNDTDIVESPQAVRRVLGYLPQDFGYYPDLALEEFLEYVAALRGLDSETASARIAEMLALTNLSEVRSRKLKTFSGGMCQRVGIAQALLNDPDLLVVDEPTVGLDPAERVRLRSALADSATDRVVILSTHIVPDIEATADRIALLDNGRLVTHTTVEDLIDRIAGDVYECRVTQKRTDALREEYRVCSTTKHGDGVTMRIIAETPPTNTAERVEPTLEDAYFDAVDHLHEH